MDLFLITVGQSAFEVGRPSMVFARLFIITAECLFLLEAAG
jgi:hypothetical protein